MYKELQEANLFKKKDDFSCLNDTFDYLKKVEELFKEHEFEYKSYFLSVKGVKEQLEKRNWFYTIVFGKINEVRFSSKIVCYTVDDDDTYIK
jgi:hypothetical protein